MNKINADASHSALSTGVGQRLTKHAQRRMQQRAIQHEAVELVLAYGEEVRSRGASLLFFDGPSRWLLAGDVQPKLLKRIGGRLNICVVAGEEGRIVTVSHRTTRVRRDVATRLH